MIIYAQQNGAEMATFAATGTRADIDAFSRKSQNGIRQQKIFGCNFNGSVKIFDCFDADGFGRSALGFIYSYLSARKQRVKVNGSFCNWRETNLGVP